MTAPSDQSWMLDLIKIFAMQDDNDSTTEDLFWSIDANGGLRVSVNCSDVFSWGTADAEYVEPSDLDDLRRAKADALATYADDDRRKWREFDWPQLWVARKRGERPQGAYFTRHLGTQPMRDLFAAAGPQRQGGVLGDPDHYEPEELK